MRRTGRRLQFRKTEYRSFKIGFNAPSARERTTAVRLDDITPYILTYNEEDNIGKCLGALRWAKHVVVVDSFSTDRTLQIIAEFPNTRVVQRVFDSHSRQHNFALEQIPESNWVLRLDADWILTPELLSE